MIEKLFLKEFKQVLLRKQGCTHITDEIEATNFIRPQKMDSCASK
jgi:hypothetical protein